MIALPPAGPTTPLTIQGPGGTGKTVLLAELAAGSRRAGVPVLDPRSDQDLDGVPGEFTVLVDAAERLTDDAAERLRPLVQHPGARVTVAYRPWPRPAPLRRLLADLGGERRSVVLGHVDREVLRRWADDLFDGSAPPQLVDFVHHHTGGLPALAHPLLRSLAEERVRGTRPAPGQPPRIAVPDDVVELVRAGLAGLDDDTRALLHAVSAGADLDEEVVGALLDLSPHEAADVAAKARATGLLLGSGVVVPLVQAVLLAETPADVTRRTRQRLLALLGERGDEPVEIARALAADRVSDRRAAQLLERHGRAALGADPDRAVHLLEEAVAAGAAPTRLAASRAQAAALTGDLDRALQFADPVLADEQAPDRPRAAAVAGAVLARRGLLARSADLFRLAGPERSGAAALALLGAGHAGDAAAVLASAREDGGQGSSAMLTASESLTAAGVQQSLRTGADAAGDIAAALSTLTRAAALLEPLGRTALLIDTPAALAALVGVHSGELDVAESILQRALARDVGGRPSRARHLLLLAWVAMLRGRLDRARGLMTEARASAGDPLEPRDELFARALEVGLARRSSDLPALVAAWAPAREAVLRYPIDLFTLLPLGELMVAAARLRDAPRLAPHVAAAQALLARLDDPLLWATSLHWSGAQAAILADDPAALKPHAAALVEAARTSPYAAVLAGAGRCWLRVLTGDVDEDAVVAAAEQLSTVGLAWDGSRLAGQAAARTRDPRVRSALLSSARALAEAHGLDAKPGALPGGGDRGAVEATQSQLSERERDVARLVVAGATYREIGGRLYISAKTVEHHVARMRQRLGASNRSDLLARLRAELATG